MKKTMIFAIILMPLVVLGMLFLGGTIVYRSTYLYVEYIEFVTNEIVLNKPTDDDVSATLQVNVYPKLANNKSVEFRSADESVAVVDSEGRVTSVDFGSTYIYAISKENSTKTATCKVTVTSDRVHRVWVDNAVSLMYRDERLQLSTHYAPFEAENATFVYTSSNPSVLYVSAGGELRAKSRGTATITVAVENDSSVYYTFDVEVKIHVEDIYISDTAPVVSSKVNFSFPDINFVPTLASETITYVSSDPSIATVDENGEINFSRAGTVTISAKADGFDKILTKTYTSTFGCISSVSFGMQNEHDFDYEDYLTGYLPLEWSFAPSDADASLVSVSSSDARVLAIEGNHVKVVGGGSAIVTLTAGNGVTAEWVVNIHRKAESVSFGVADFSYTSDRIVDLGVGYTPSDATETVRYSVSNSATASISEGVLTFAIGVVNNKYGKVKVTAYTDSGVSKTVTVVYIDASIPRVTLGDATTMDYTLPMSNRPAYSFALIVDEAVNDVDFAIVDGSSVTLNGIIVTLADKGTTRLGVYTDGTSTTDRYLDINVRRNVERIDDISLSAIVGGEIVRTYGKNDEIYSASDTYSIAYTLYPAGTTRTTADIRLVGDTDVAAVVGDEVCFSRAGVVTVQLSADGVTETVQIESTCGHPDSQTAVASRVDMRVGESFSIWDEINISPLYTKREYITYTHTGDAVSITDGVVTGECGGSATITVTIATSTGDITKTMVVAVSESATDVQVVGAQYIYTDERVVDLSTKFVVLPATANVDNTITLSVDDSSVARISESALEFISSGRVIVSATLGDVAVARIAVVYTGDEIVVDGADATKVLIGTRIIIRPSASALAIAPYDEIFIASGDATVSGVFVTVNGDADVNFGGEVYYIDGVERMTGVALTPDASQVDVVSDGRYITGLDSVTFASAVSGVDETYIDMTYTGMSTDGVLAFDRAQTVTVTLTAVYGADIIGSTGISMSASATVESTYGQIIDVTAVGSGVYDFEIDNDDSTANTIDISDYISVYPTQLTASADLLSLGSSNSDIATVDGLNVTFIKGGDTSITVGIKASAYADHGATLAFAVKRSAQYVYLDGRVLSDGDVITVHKSTIHIEPKAYPFDANMGDVVTWVASDYDGVATVDYDANNIVFQTANERIKLVFTLNERTFTVYLETSTITFEVDILADRYVVPMGEPFTFIAGGSAISDYTVAFAGFGTVHIVNDEVYQIEQSAVGTATVTYLGDTRVVPMVVTASISSISGVRISDEDKNGAPVTLGTTENAISLVTASRSVGVLYDIPTGYDADGEQITYTVSADNGARVDGLTVTFAGADVVNITIGIAYIDAYTERSVQYTFGVQSTFGNVTAFDIGHLEYSYIYDTMTDTDRIIDIASDLTRTAPEYGAVDSPIITTSNAVAHVDGGNVIIDSFGTCVVTVQWGTAKAETVIITVDKYIDDIIITDDGETVSQIVTKSETYQINHTLVVNDSEYAPTLTGVIYNASGDCSVSASGLVTLGSTDVQCVVTVSAEYGDASASLVITRVSTDVNVIPADANLEQVVLRAGERYVFDYRFGETRVGIASAHSSISVDDIDIFSGSKGAEGDITLDNGQTVHFVTTESVSDIVFSATAPDDDYITAQESISIADVYAPVIYPTSARTETGAYTVECSVQSDIAHIDDGVLVFTAPGVVTITFSAGDVTVTKIIESTVGYIKTLTIRDEYVGDIVCQYSDGSYTMPSDYFIAVPSDYYKTSVTYTSSNDVFTVDGDTLTFVGGGSTTLELKYVSTTGEQVIPVTVNILHRVKGVNIYDDDILTGYVVKNLSAGSTLDMRYECVPTIDGVTLSGHSMAFATDNASVATVDSDGVITIQGNGTAVITVTVINDYDSAVDATASVIIRNDTGYNILTVYAGSLGTDHVIDIEDGRVPIVYPIFNAMVSDFDFGVQDGGSVAVSDDGVLTVTAGGTTTVAVTADETTTLTVYVYKKARITLPTALANASANGTTVVTAQTAYTIGATFGPSDAMDRKTVVYESSDESVATVADGVITFYKAQTVEITVRITYNGTSEKYQRFKIRSTLGKAESFEVDYTAWEMLVGETKTFYINNVQPSDFSGTLTATTTNTDAHTLSISGMTLTVTGAKGGSGVITVKFIGSDTQIDISVDVVQLTDSIGFRYNDTAVTNVTTFTNTVTLTASVSPTDATDKGVTWSVISGPASVTNGTVTFSDYGTATVRARARDYDRSGTESTIVINYIKDIDSFDLTYSSDTLDNEQTVYVEWNVKNVELGISIQPDDLTGNVYYSYFTATATDGATVSIDTDGGYVNVKISNDATATYSTTVTVRYKNKYVKTATIYRDGISSVEFVGHDDALDLECGLQRVRVTGNKSYYDGTVRDYYRMPVTVSPASADTSNIVWEIGNTNVTYDQTLVTIDGVTYVYLYFNAITGSSVAEVYADDFTAGTVVVSAMNKLGRTLDTYTFHIVNAVNIWDETGFMNGGSAVVLQKSLGHDDQAELIADPTTAGSYARLDNYQAKTTIYGNGHLINYAYYNNTATVTEWGYIAITLTNAINLEIQGSNYDESRDTYHIELSAPQRIAYCTLYNMYRAVEAGGGTSSSPTTINIKNTLFRTFAHSTINLSNDGYRVVNLTNVIMFDVGQRAIESQSENDVINISGRFDVYNFQNSSALKKATSTSISASLIINKAKSNKMAVTAMSDTWANVVIIATKQTLSSAKTKVYYDGVENAVPSISSITSSGYKVWATLSSDTEITWEHEFVVDSSTSAGYRLNETYMISTISKLKRVV